MLGNKGKTRGGDAAGKALPDAAVGRMIAYDEAAGNGAGLTEPLDARDGADGSSFDVGFGQTIGSRNEQQDSLCYSNYKNRAEIQTRGLLLAVCDGIGGVSGGQRASQTAVRTMYEEFMKQDCTVPPADRLLELTAAAHKAVLRLGQGGTTMVAGLIVGNAAYFASVGDSRICLCRSGGLLTLNRVHVYEHMLNTDKALGLREDADAKGKAKALTAFLGQTNLRQIDRTVHPIRLIPGDRLVLMSDGVFNTLSESDILISLKETAKQTAECIIERIEETAAPHQDNATILIARVF